MLNRLSCSLAKSKTATILTRRASSKGIVKTPDLPLAQTDELASVYAFENSLRVACFSNDSEVSSTAIHVECGTRSEVPEKNGICNMIAQLAGKGTTSTKQEDLQMRLSKLGASLDINVNREYTSFVVTGLSKDAVEHADIVSDVVKNAIFDQNDLEKAKDEILSHIWRQQNNLPLVTMDYLYSVAYQGTNMSNSLTGTADNVRSIQRKDVTDFVHNHYKAPRMLLASVGGNAKLETLVKSAERNLKDVSTEYSYEAATYPAPCRFSAMEVQHRDDDLPLAHVALGINGCSYGSPDKIPLMLLTEMMGTHTRAQGGLGKGLHMLGQVVQSPTDYIYHWSGFSHFYSDCGMFGAYYVAAPEQLWECGLLLGKFWMNLCHNMMDAMLIKAKRSLKKQIIQDMYDPQAIQDKLAQDIFFGTGRPESFQEIMDKIDSVSVKQLEEIATEYINDADFARSAYGPTEAVTDYNIQKSHLWWMRW